MHILNYNKFCESISGQEFFTTSIGPNYGKQILPNTISSKDTDLIYLELTDEYYSLYDFQELYNNYRKLGGKEDLSLFNKNNLNIIINYLNKNSC